MNEIEAALAAWTPCPPQIDRDRLMFAAGRASHSPAILAGTGFAHYLWPLTTCLSTAAAVVLAFLLAQQPPAESLDRVAQGAVAQVEDSSPQVAVSPTPVSPPLWGGISLPVVADGTYLALRNQMLTTPANEWELPRTRNDDARRGWDPARRGSPDPAVNRQPPTSRNLLREFLPPERPARQRPPNPTESPAAQTNQPQEALT